MADNHSCEGVGYGLTLPVDTTVQAAVVCSIGHKPVTVTPDNMHTMRRSRSVEQFDIPCQLINAPQ